MSHTDTIIMLGATPVTVRIYENGNGPLYIRVHENEYGAGNVGVRLVREHGGIFIDLVHAGTREVTFSHDGHVYSFDPNRIFSEKGLVRTLSTETGILADEVYAHVRTLRDHITAVLADRPVIALHNNYGTGYTLRSYMPDGSEYRGDGKTHAYCAGGDVRNFMVTTDRGLHDSAHHLGISSAHQDPAHEEDDGSLSVYYGTRGIWYVNIEAAYEAEERQYEIARMLGGYVRSVEGE